MGDVFFFEKFVSLRDQHLAWQGSFSTNSWLVNKWKHIISEWMNRWIYDIYICIYIYTYICIYIYILNVIVYTFVSVLILFVHKYRHIYQHLTIYFYIVFVCFTFTFLDAFYWTVSWSSVYRPIPQPRPALGNLLSYLHVNFDSFDFWLSMILSIIQQITPRYHRLFKLFLCKAGRANPRNIIWVSVNNRYSVSICSCNPSNHFTWIAHMVDIDLAGYFRDGPIVHAKEQACRFAVLHLLWLFDIVNT